MSEDLVAVAVDCRHPDRHESDTVFLRPKLGLASGIAVQRLIVEANQSFRAPLELASMTGILAEAYLLHGVADWTLGPPVNAETIRRELLDDFERGAPVAEKADDLYMGAVIAPLLSRGSTSSPSTSSNGSTSAPGNGQPPPRKRSKRSSTSTTRTAATAATSK